MLPVHRRASPWILACASCCCIGASPSHGQESAVSADELAEMIQESMLEAESFETTVRSFTSPLILDDAPAPPLDQWERWQEIQSTYWRDQLRQRIDSRSQPPNGPLSTAGLLRVWTGAFTFQLADGDTGISITGQAAPADWDNQGFLFDQVVGRYPTWVELPELLSTGTILDHTLEDGRLRVKFHPPASDEMVFQLELETEPAVRLRRVFREFTRQEPTAIINRQEFIIDEWRDFDGLILPARARLIASELGREGFEDRWIKTITYYERLAARPLTEPPPSGYWEIPYEEDMGIHDARLNFSFAVGSRNFYYDGASYTAPEPLMRHPEENLPELIARSVRLVMNEEAQPVAEAPPAPTWRAWIIGGIAAVGSGLLLFALLRFLNHRR